MSDSTEKNMRSLIQFLNNNSYVNYGTLKRTTFYQEACNKGINLNGDFINRKCSLTQDEIEYILNNNICQYVTIPYSIINKTLKYNLGNFSFYSIVNIIRNYDKYSDIYNVACSQQQLSKGNMIYLSCYKNTNKFIFRTETLDQIKQFSNINNIIITLNNAREYNYGDALIRIYKNNI